MAASIGDDIVVGVMVEAGDGIGVGLGGTLGAGALIMGALGTGSGLISSVVFLSEKAMGVGMGSVAEGRMLSVGILSKTLFSSFLLFKMCFCLNEIWLWL